MQKMDSMQSNTPNKHDGSPEAKSSSESNSELAVAAVPSPPARQVKRSASAAEAASDTTDSLKRDRDEDMGEEELDPATLATMTRSERKRYREKKRRSDVNKGFDDLMNLLIEIDPEVRTEAEERARRGQWKGSIGAQEDNLLSRVDLIGRTVSVLHRVHQENEQRKAIIGQLLHGTAGRSESLLRSDEVSEVAKAGLASCRTERDLSTPTLIPNRRYS